ncbi:MAG: hypothetical protein AAFN77_24520 [Planctomycetota bacterium]
MIIPIVVVLACAGTVALYAQVADVNSNTTPKKDTTAEVEWVGVPSDGLRSMNTLRAKVPGGWLVTTQYSGGGRDSMGGMAFVPDPKHEWQISAASDNQDADND